MRQYLNIRANIALGLIFAFLANMLGPVPIAKADSFFLPAPGQMVALSPAFSPAVLKGIKLDPKNPFQFHFFVDKGDSTLSQEELKQESAKLIKYFLASLTIPEKDLWVNLSPYEKDRIVPQEFGQTEMGRDLLAQDYLLKQITASLIYPESQLGKEFWQKVYAQAQAKYGTTNIPINTFNKVWIVPEKAVVYENGGVAFVLENHLKVMLEQDYLAQEKNNSLPLEGRAREGVDTNAIGSQIVREIVIPALTKEVNEGKNFAQLRQVFYSLILATWYKKKIKDSILNKVYANQNKISGVNVSAEDKDKIYQQYLKAFKKGAYNYIKEELDQITGQPIPRKYFSGGVIGSVNPAMSYKSPKDITPAQMATFNLAQVVDVGGDFAMINQKSISPAMLQKVKIGMLGVGKFGSGIFKTLATTPDLQERLQLKALLGKSTSSDVRELAKQHNIEIIDSPDQAHAERNNHILSDPLIKAVIIATPAKTHYEIVKAALNAGKDVYVEKPFTLDSQEPEELVQLAKEKGLVLIVGHLFLHSPQFQYLQSLVHKGILGEIMSIKASILNLSRPGLDKTSNVVEDLGYHDLYMVAGLLKQDFPNELKTVKRSTNWETAQLNMQYGQTNVEIDVSRDHQGVAQRRVVVQGTKYAMIFDHSKVPYTLEIEPTAKDNYDQQELESLRAEIQGVSKELPLAPQMRAFVEAVHQRQALLAGGESAISIVKIVSKVTQLLSGDNLEVHSVVLKDEAMVTKLQQAVGFDPVGAIRFFEQNKSSLTINRNSAIPEFGYDLSPLTVKELAPANNLFLILRAAYDLGGSNQSVAKDILAVYRRTSREEPFTIQRLTFPSPFTTTPFKNSELVYANYYLPKNLDGRPIPAVVICSFWEDSFARLASWYLASKGIAVLEVGVPIYGLRTPPIDKQGGGTVDRFIALDFDAQKFKSYIMQSVADTLVAVRWLASRPEIDKSRLGVAGQSVMGSVAASSSFIDPMIQQTLAVVLVSNYANVLPHAKKSNAALFRLGDLLSFVQRKDLKFSQLNSDLQGISLQALANNYPKKPKSFSLVYVTDDELVPSADSEELRKLLGDQDFYPTQGLPGQKSAHFSGSLNAFYVLERFLNEMKSSAAMKSAPASADEDMSSSSLDGEVILRFGGAAYYSGGVVTHLTDLDRELLKRRNVTIIRLSYKSDGIRSESKVGKGTLIEIPMLNETQLGSTLDEIFAKYKVDLVINHYAKYDDGRIINEKSLKHKIPVLFQFHLANSVLSKFPREVEELARGINALATVSSLDIPPHLKSMTTVLGDGIDTDYFNSSNVGESKKEELRRELGVEPDEKIIVLPARIHEGKGQMDIVKIAALLKAKGDKFKIFLVGYQQTAAVYERVRDEIVRLGLEGDVKFTGNYEKEKLRTMYSLSDVAVLPSASEGISRVLLEAGSMGKPVVAYKNDGMQEEVVDGETGYLVPNANYEAFANAIDVLLKDERLRGNLGKHAREFVEKNFSLPLLIQRHEKLYMEIINRAMSTTTGEDVKKRGADEAMNGLEWLMRNTESSEATFEMSREFGDHIKDSLPERQLRVLYPSAGGHLAPLIIAYHLIDTEKIDKAVFYFVDPNPEAFSKFVKKITLLGEHLASFNQTDADQQTSIFSWQYKGVPVEIRYIKHFFPDVVQGADANAVNVLFWHRPGRVAFSGKLPTGWESFFDKFTGPMTIFADSWSVPHTKDLLIQSISKWYYRTNKEFGGHKDGIVFSLKTTTGQTANILSSWETGKAVAVEKRPARIRGRRDAAMIVNMQPLQDILRRFARRLKDVWDRNDAVKMIISKYDQGYNLVGLGENHNSLTTVQLERKILQGLINKKSITHLAFEWPTLYKKELLSFLQQWSNSNLTPREFIKEYEGRINADFRHIILDLYYDSRLNAEVVDEHYYLLKDAYQAGIPIICTDNRQGMERIDSVTAQREMAFNIVQGIKEYEKPKVLVIGGSNHMNHQGVGTFLEIKPDIKSYFVNLLLTSFPTGPIWGEFEAEISIPRDSAMLNDSNKQKGGIDMNPAQMSMQVKKEGEDFKFDFNGVEIDAAQVTGVTFTINQMTPVVNLPQILGLNQELQSTEKVAL